MACHFIRQRLKLSAPFGVRANQFFGFHELGAIMKSN
jgi:hypothetical protein